MVIKASQGLNGPLATYEHGSGPAIQKNLNPAESGCFKGWNNTMNRLGFTCKVTTTNCDHASWQVLDWTTS